MSNPARLTIEVCGAVSESPAEQLRLTRLFAALAVACAAVAGLGFWRDVDALKGLGVIAGAMFLLGTVVTLHSWRVARDLGPMTLTLIDARHDVSSGSPPGIECVVGFERAPVAVSATLSVLREQRFNASSSARVAAAIHYIEEIELQPATDARTRFVGRFPATATYELPPSGPAPDGEPLRGAETRWKLEVRVHTGPRRHRLPYELRATLLS